MLESLFYSETIVLYGLLCSVSGSIIKMNYFTRWIPLTVPSLVFILCDFHHHAYV